MKLIAIFIIANFLLIAVNVTAQEAVNIVEYKQQILAIINEYKEKFDDCLLILPNNFPDVSTEYLELNERIGELKEKTWYHRSLERTSSNYATDEIFFYMSWGNSQYAISIRYFFINNTQTFTIPTLYLLSDDYGGPTGDFGHIVEGGIPSEVADASIDAIKTCMGIPGFLFIFFIMAVVVVLIFYSRYKK